MGMLIKQGKGYTGAALAWRRVEVASPRDPDSTVRNGFHALTISTLVLVKGTKSDRE
jgi:hypothetical protein